MCSHFQIDFYYLIFCEIWFHLLFYYYNMHSHLSRTYVRCYVCKVENVFKIQRGDRIKTSFFSQLDKTLRTEVYYFINVKVDEIRYR